MMKILNDAKDQQYAEHMAARAMDALERAIGVLEHAIDRFRGPDDEIDEKTLMAEIKALNGAFLFALKMREAARAAGCETFEIGHPELDLGAARDEIGRRLACLRAACDEGAVS